MGENMTNNVAKITKKVWTKPAVTKASVKDVTHGMPNPGGDGGVMS